MNYSRQREMILNILSSSKSHPTAEEVLEEVKKQEKWEVGAGGTPTSRLPQMGSRLRGNMKRERVGKQNTRLMPDQSPMADSTSAGCISVLLST